MIDWVKLSIYAAIVLGIFTAGSVTGARWVQGSWDAEKVQMQEELLAEKEVLRIAEKRAAWDGLQFRQMLTKRELELKELHEERKRNAKKTVVNRKCLDAGTVGMLNGSGSGLPLPRSAGEVAPEGSGEVAASDGDVVDWVSNANESYEVCAERLNGLIDELSGSGESEDATR